MMPVVFTALALTMPQAEAGKISLRDELERIVDLEDPRERADAAKVLAEKPEITIDALLEAMRDFGSFPKAPPGAHTIEEKLRVGEEWEKTEITIFVPRSYDPDRPAPLLLAFHGSGGGGKHMHRMWQSLAEEMGLLVLSPSEAGPNAGYDFSRRGRLNVLACLRWARRRFNIDENSIHATGISRGGHLAWDLALRYPDLFASIAPMIGGPRVNPAEGQNNLRYIENLHSLPIRDLQGANDDPRLLTNLRLAFARLESLGNGNARLLEQPDHGHSFDLAAVDWKEFFGASVRDPLPTRVVRSCALLDESRSYWIEATGFAKDVSEEIVLRAPKSTWESMNEEARRSFLMKEADEHTARIEATMLEPGKFRIESKRVTKCRLLLTDEMLAADRPVLVRFQGKTHRKRLERSKAVLLVEFAERFDRTFLPVAVFEL